MSQLSENTTALQTLLEAVNALPDYTGDIECTSVTATGDITAGGNIGGSRVTGALALFNNAGVSETLEVGGELSANGGISGVTNYPAAGVEELTGGRWIDGKPIYRQVIVFGALSKGSSTTKPLALGEGEMLGDVIKLAGAATSLYSASAPTWLSLNHAQDNDPEKFNVDITIRNILTTSPVVQLRTGTSVPIGKAYAIVEYTKSTD